MRAFFWYEQQNKCTYFRSRVLSDSSSHGMTYILKELSLPWLIATTRVLSKFTACFISRFTHNIPGCSLWITWFYRARGMRAWIGKISLKYGVLIKHYLASTVPKSQSSDASFANIHEYFPRLWSFLVKMMSNRRLLVLLFSRPLLTARDNVNCNLLLFTQKTATCFFLSAEAIWLFEIAKNWCVVVVVDSTCLNVSYFQF
jgi:hypothetical protein